MRVRQILFIAAIALNFAAIGTCAAATSSSAQQSHPWIDKYWTHPDGTRFHYIEMGKGPAVILIHGYQGSAAGNWFLNGIAASLAPTNRVIGIDMRGHGLTTPNPAEKGSMARDVLAFMDAQGIKQAHIGGYSMGGFITSQLMALAPERFITAHFGGSGLPEIEELRAMIPPDKKGSTDMEKQAMDKFTATRTAAAAAGQQIGNGADRAPVTATPTTTSSATATPPATTPATTPAPRPSLASVTGTDPDMPPIDLTKIKFPVLQVIGEYDNPNRNGHRLWRELHNYQRVVLPDRGHISAIAPNFIHPAYIDSMTKFITQNNPRVKK